MKLSGWGNYPVVDALEFVPRNEREALKFINSGEHSVSIIPRGLGRSYGDSSLAEVMVNTHALDHFKSFDSTTGMLNCAAGVSLASILEVFVPKGWFPFVTPGTKFVTVGGAIASDVHGKNHHIDGCFSDHVLEMRVATPAMGVVTCSPDKNSDLFHATAGGMGLTGIILDATIRLRPIKSAQIREKTIKARSLTEALELFEGNRNAPYSVAWIDCLSSGASLGRSLISLGEHSEEGGLYAASNSKLSMPFNLPGATLNRYSISAFNYLYYNKASDQSRDSERHYDGYFYPLDKILHWNRMYGKRGFVQYQLALPTDGGKEGLTQVLQRIVRSRKASFLAVLKSFGNSNANLLSFPLAGYTLALDFKVERSIFPFLDELDRIVLDHGGRLYLAKDARMSVATFRASYPDWERFVEVRQRYGADQLFNSVQSARLGLTT